jgi:hypothetical protein
VTFANGRRPSQLSRIALALTFVGQERAERMRRKPRRRSSAAQLSLLFDRAGHSLRQFWQARFCGFNVWSQKKKVEKLQYMHLDSVNRRLVSHPKDWPWSSSLFYASRNPGLVRIDPVS